MVLSRARAAVLAAGAESAHMEKVGGANRGGATRTLNLRFWRPLLCQLSYTPSQVVSGQQAVASLNKTGRESFLAETNRLGSLFADHWH